MDLSFYKYHGAGNDFIMLDNRADDRRLWNALTPEKIEQLCIRHHGIGADGLILAIKSDNPEMPYTMGYFNADGTPAEMCGNGLRCLVRFLDDLGEPVREMERINIMTGAGPVQAAFTEDNLIRVWMPIPSFHPRDAGIDYPTEAVDAEVEIPGWPNPLMGTAVGVGNPHFVLYNAEMWEGYLVHEIGARMAIYKDLFPNGVNVGFARKEGDNLMSLVVWERGVGPTLACGSGAIAAAAAGVKTGRYDFDEQIMIRMPGGLLGVTIGQDWKSAVLEGDAVRVFEGKVEI